MFISTIIWRLIFVNQYYDFPMEFPGEKVGQFVQARLQVGHHSCLVKYRFKIAPFRGHKRLHEAIFPRRVENGN